MKSAPTLRPYQSACLDAIAGAVASGLNRVLIRMATGGGKTVCFAAMPEWAPIKSWLELFPAKERKMLVIAHREELLDQAAEKIHAANPHLRVSVEQGDRFASSFSDVVVASIQTLAASKFKRLDRLMARHVFRLVIVDEAHHAAASTYRGALSRLGFLPPAGSAEAENIDAADANDVDAMTAALEAWDKDAPRDRLLVGVTATPNRSDAIGLGCVFQSIVYNYHLRDAIKDEWLVPIVPWVIETDTSLDAVKINRGEFNQRELAEAVNQEPRNAMAVAAWQAHAPGRQTIAFTVDVAHAQAVALKFRAHGVHAVAVSGETPKEERRQMLREFRSGQITMLCNCMVLTEGTDLPMASCILHLKPTKSATLYEQMTGRGLRLSDGKDDCVVIDLVDVARRHSLQTAPVLYGLPPQLKSQGKKLDQVAEEWEDFAAKYPHLNAATLPPITLEELRAKATTFDVWTVPEMGVFGQGLSMNWIRSNDNTFRLQYPWGDGTEVLLIEPDLVGKFEVKVLAIVKAAQRAAQNLVRVLASGFGSAQAALAAAEQFVMAERRTVTRLKASDASWRGRPASPKQVALLRKFKCPVVGMDGLTAGQASDLIDVAMARRKR